MYLVDTNIIIQKIRESTLWEDVSKTYFGKGVKNHGFISYVTNVELHAFAYENNWGKKKMMSLRETFKRFHTLPIENRDILNAYVQISAFSRNKHKSVRLPKKFPVSNMGKNDLWIAATAAAGQLPLITTDKDFFHLDGKFINLIFIDQDKYFNPPQNV
jgi:predicted nucleic acid-binding protein